MIGKFLKVQSKQFKVQSLLRKRRLYNSDKSKIHNSKSKIQMGFSLLELMIAMFILIILLTVAIPTYQSSVKHARETVLKENLWQMRRSIDQYATDKGKLPQSLQDLVDGGYLREIPADPINEEKREWDEVQGEDIYSSEGNQGLKDVKSMAQGTDSDGKNYSEY